jgi:hypothetical protein
MPATMRGAQDVDGGALVGVGVPAGVVAGVVAGPVAEEVDEPGPDDGGADGVAPGAVLVGTADGACGEPGSVVVVEPDPLGGAGDGADEQAATSDVATARAAHRSLVARRRRRSLWRIVGDYRSQWAPPPVGHPR